MEKFISAIRSVPVEFDPFEGPPLLLSYPTTGPQREVWTASQMGDEASCSYNESVSLELTGALDAPALRDAIGRLVERHEALRTVFSGTGLRALVLGTMDIALEVHDLTGKGEAERIAAMSAIGHALMTTPFDLARGPLFRFTLFHLAPGQHVLRTIGHHAVCDGWSMGILLGDLSRLYSALHLKTAPELPEAVPYSRFADAMGEHERSGASAEVTVFWKDLFKAPVPRLDLPTDRPRPQERTWKATRMDIPLDPVLVGGLRRLATRSGSSFVTTLLTLYETLLARITGQRDIVVGLPAAGQSDLGMERLVGHCVALLPMRSKPDEGMTFLEHLRERRKGVLDAFDHQRFTFSTLLRELDIPREPGRVPLVPAIFNIDMDMDDGVSFEGLRHRITTDPRAYEQFELALNVAGSGDRLVMEWSWNTDLFDTASVRGWMDLLVSLAGKVVEAPETRLAELLEHGVGGTAAVPAEWSGPLRELDPESTVDKLFDRAALAHGDRTALVHGAETITYAALRDRVDALAAHLVRSGARPGTLIGLCASPGIGLIAGLLAILRAGAAFVPIDTAYPDERLKAILTDARPDQLLTDRKGRERLRDFPGTVVPIDGVAQPGMAGERPPFTARPEDPIYMIHTSGSTGTPKGVLVPHRGIVRLMVGQDYFAFGPDLVFHHHLSISFDACQLSIMGALLHGGKLVIGTGDSPSLPEIANSIPKHGVNTLITSTGLFKLLVEEHLPELAGLRHLMVGGDVLPLAPARKVFDLLGPGVIVNGYGPTEGSVMCTTFTVQRREDLDGPLPIGKPLVNAPAHVLNADMEPVRIGQKGELYLGGPGVAIGYWRRPETTAERFVPDPFSGDEGARLYRTGDMVRWRPDGNLEFIGRMDEQVKVRGYRVELGELEAALDDMPAVKDRVAAAFAMKGGEKRLHVYAVPTDPAVVEADGPHRTAWKEKVRAHLAERLPEHMVPATVIPIGSVPLNTAGKPDRKKLPTPPSTDQLPGVAYMAPRNPEERTLAELWSRLLGVEHVGVHDNFFELGGDSLMGVHLFAQLEKRTGRRLPVKTLFRAPTIARMAPYLVGQAQPAPDWKHLMVIQPKGDRTPFFCVHGDEANVFLPQMLGEDRPFYGFGHQGEDGQRIDHTTVEDIARHFIDEMRSVRPRGPYLLGGYSFGGIVAYEMARQLAASGEDVPLLALFDTYAPEDGMRAAAQDETMFTPLKRLAVRRLVKHYLDRGMVVPPRLRHFHTIDTYRRATSAYKPGRYPGKLTLIRTRDSPGSRDMGWGRLVTGDVDLRLVDGDHYSIIRPPHVQQLGGELLRCIGSIAKEETTGTSLTKVHDG